MKVEKDDLYKKNINKEIKEEIFVESCNLSTEQIAMGYCCEDCPEWDICSLTKEVSFCIPVCEGFNTPDEPLINDVQIIWDESCLNCTIEKCQLPATVINPCGSTIIDCTACINKAKYIGCIKYLASYSKVTGDDSINTASACYCCSECINQTIGYFCAYKKCPPVLVNKIEILGVNKEICSTCGNFIKVTAKITFNDLIIEH